MEQEELISALIITCVSMTPKFMLSGLDLASELQTDRLNYLLDASYWTSLKSLKLYESLTEVMIFALA